MFFFCAGKFGALFASIPFTIFAAVYCVLFGLVGRVTGTFCYEYYVHSTDWLIAFVVF
jgi:xanthine/uracil permease